MAVMGQSGCTAAGAQRDDPLGCGTTSRTLMADQTYPLSAAALTQLMAAGRDPAEMVAEVEAALGQFAAA